MTSNIVQHVAPRKRTVAGSRSGFSFWGQQARGRGPRRFERGSAQHSTMTAVLGVIALVLVGALGFFYLQQVVSTASQGTDIHQLETRITELRERQRELELEGAQLRSLQAVEDRVQKLNLVTTEQVTYLAPTRSRVAAEL